jgi:hypothetical protein
MAGQNTITNFFTTDFIPDFPDLAILNHTNENTGVSVVVPPNPGDHQHVTVQFTDLMISTGEVLARGTYFDNGGVTASGPGLTFNEVAVIFPVEGQTRDVFHFNNHLVDHSVQENTNTLLDAIQQPQADLTNLQHAAADTVSTHDAGLQPDLHAANVHASAFHL